MCKECNRRDSCISLCAIAEKYANQDIASHAEEAHMADLGLDIDYFRDLEENSWFGTTKNNNRLIYELYFLENKSVEEIAYHIDLPVLCIEKIVKKYKDSVAGIGKKRKILEMHFIEGESNLSVIARELKVVKQYTSAIILSHLKKWNKNI